MVVPTMRYYLAALSLVIFTTRICLAQTPTLGLQDGEDLVLPRYDLALGPIAQGLYESITAIQEGREEWQGWSVRCDVPDESGR